MGEDQAPYSGILGAPTADVAQTAPPVEGYAGMTESHPIVAQMNTPAASPQELEKRKVGWQQVYERMTTDPNMIRALGFFGASLAQPRPIGQTGAGAFGQAAVSGMSAFESGKTADFERSQQEKETARKEAESKATVDLAQARLPGTQAESRVAVETADTKIQKAKDDAEKFKVDLDKAKGDEALAKLEREGKARIARLEAEIPDETMRNDIRAKYELALSRAAELRARARKEGSAAKLGDLQVQTVEDMDAQERKEFFSKTGRHSGTVSALTQQRDMWEQIYDKLPDNDATKKGKTREQFVMDRLTTQKAQDAVKNLTDALKAGIDDPELIRLMTEDVRRQMQGRAGQPADGGGAPKTVMVWDAKQRKYVPQKPPASTDGD